MIEDEGQINHDFGQPVVTTCPKCHQRLERYPSAEGPTISCSRCLATQPPIITDRAATASSAT